MPSSFACRGSRATIARLLALTPPSTPNSTAPSAGQMTSPARLPTSKTRSCKPKCRGMRASLGRMMAAYPDAAIIASKSTPPTASAVTILLR